MGVSERVSVHVNKFHLENVSAEATGETDFFSQWFRISTITL